MFGNQSVQGIQKELYEYAVYNEGTVDRKTHYVTLDKKKASEFVGKYQTVIQNNTS